MDYKTVNQWIQRMKEFIQLEDGWADGEGVSVNPHILDPIHRLILETSDVVPFDAFGPMPEGGVELNWKGTIGPERIVMMKGGFVEIHNDGRLVLWDSKISEDDFIETTHIDEIIDALLSFQSG